MRDSTPTWQQILAQGFSSAGELLDFLNLPRTLASARACEQFKTRVPRGFAARMRVGDPDDPLLRQILATEEEVMLQPDGFVTDPLNEAATNPMQGLIHKYRGRVLLTLTGACAVNCRYCFRRHFPYQANNPGRAGWRTVLDYVAGDSSIQEIILSGGDPLLAKDEMLADLFAQIALIPHVKTLRIHTRLPVVLPERIQSGLLDLLALIPLHKVIVVHCNHPQELDGQVEQAVCALRRVGCHVLNQSVLLAGVNDEVEVLAALSERLFACGILPYYLHLLDKVRGAAHFAVPDEQAVALFMALQARLPGYLVPRLAREEAGKSSKTLVFSASVQGQ